jgi:hypothetical protein
MKFPLAFPRHTNKNIETKKPVNSGSYLQFIKAMMLTAILCFSINPVRDILIILCDFRLPLTEDGMFYSQRMKEKYASQISKPKIVIVAGSSALLGLSAEQIEVSVNKPTVNFGTHAGFGIDYILQKAKVVLNSGDTVLLPIEFELYHQGQDKQLLSSVLKRHVISYDRNYIFNLNYINQLKTLLYPSSFDENRKIIKAFYEGNIFSALDKKYIYQRALDAASQGICYTGITLNKNGDETCNIGRPPIENIEKRKIDINYQPIDPSGSIKDFLRFTKKNQIKVIPLYPALLQASEYRSNDYKKYFSRIKLFWIEQGIHFEDSIDTMTLEREMMFDTHYHPNDKGRKIRTQKVVDIICRTSCKTRTMNSWS